MAASAAPLILLRSESYRMKTEQALCLMPTPSHNAMRPNARRPSVVQACATVTFVAGDDRQRRQSRKCLRACHYRRCTRCARWFDYERWRYWFSSPMSSKMYLSNDLIYCSDRYSNKCRRDWLCATLKSRPSAIRCKQRSALFLKIWR